MQYLIHKTQGPHQQFQILLEQNVFSFYDFGGFEDRNSSTINLIIQALKNNESLFEGKRLHVAVNTSDQIHANCLNYAHPSEPSYTLPDFSFDHWKQVGIQSFSSMVADIKKASKTPYSSSKVLWAGSIGPWIPPRVIYKQLAEAHRDLLQCNEIDFSTKIPTASGDPDKQPNILNFVSLPDHCKHKYLLDIEGIGWSARLKYLCFTNRVLFLNDRPYKEFWMNGLVNGENCIILKRDLSDLVEKVNMVENDPQLYAKLSSNLLKFANETLTMESVNRHIVQVLAANAVNY
jgi:hypothetical protein